ncbi:MAG: hypothetical protein R3Y32_06355 [Bacillota bacterium]
MIMITGKVGSGKNAFAVEKFGGKVENCFFLTRFLLENLNQTNREQVKIQALESAVQFKIAICDELGCRVSPMDKFQLLQTETNGEIACEIARVASEVYLVENAVGVKIK